MCKTEVNYFVLFANMWPPTLGFKRKMEAENYFVLVTSFLTLKKFANFRGMGKIRVL